MGKDFKTVGLYPYEYQVQYDTVEQLETVIKAFKNKVPNWKMIKCN